MPQPRESNLRSSANTADAPPLSSGYRDRGHRQLVCSTVFVRSASTSQHRHHISNALWLTCFRSAGEFAVLFVSAKGSLLNTLSVSPSISRLKSYLSHLHHQPILSSRGRCAMLTVTSPRSKQKVIAATKMFACLFWFPLINIDNNNNNNKTTTTTTNK